MLLGYLRVSKGDDQSTALQRRALTQAGVERFFEETASGGRWDRSELHRLLDQLRTEDVVVVWKLDRLSRSLKDLLAILDRIEERGAGFRSVTEAVDTTIPAGRAGGRPNWRPPAQAQSRPAGGCHRQRPVRTADGGADGPPLQHQ